MIGKHHRKYFQSFLQSYYLVFLLKLRKLIKLTEKKSFIKVYLLKDVDIIKQLYSSLGYNFAEVETKIRVIDDKSLDLASQTEELKKNVGESENISNQENKDADDSGDQT